MGAAVNGKRRRVEPAKNVGLHFEIGLDVVVGRHRALMAEPEGDDFQRDTGLKQMKRRCVAEKVRRDLPTFERGTLTLRPQYGQSQAKARAGAGQRSAEPIAEDELCGLQAICPAPLLEQSSGLYPERYGALLPSLTVETHGVVGEIRQPHGGQFRNACACVVHESEEEPIATAAPIRSVERIEDGPDFLAAETAK